MFLFLRCRTCLELASIADEVGVPAGVFNVVTGLGQDVGAPLASHPDVDKVVTASRQASVGGKQTSLQPSDHRAGFFLIDVPKPTYVSHLVTIVDVGGLHWKYCHRQVCGHRSGNQYQGLFLAWSLLTCPPPLLVLCELMLLCDRVSQPATLELGGKSPIIIFDDAVLTNGMVFKLGILSSA